MAIKLTVLNKKKTGLNRYEKSTKKLVKMSELDVVVSRGETE